MEMAGEADVPATDVIAYSCASKCAASV